MQRKESHASFGGQQEVWQHTSTSLKTEATFAIYLPPQAKNKKVPVLYWLSGLTCTEQNFISKAGAQRAAAELGIAIVAPDTSPRGAGVADDESYDLGQGAGFYVNATQEPWADHYRMYDYVTRELPELIEAHFPVTQVRGLSGHSMGGFGAIMIALRNPGRYRSVSAFSPIVSPTLVPWGEKAFTAYLGADRKAWADYDPIALIQTAQERLPILIDQGLADDFLTKQLKPELLQEAAQKVGHEIILNPRQGYDHSYYFIASFIEDHLRHFSRCIEYFGKIDDKIK